ncbi:MAG: histidine kinase [Bacteroidota bacterium]
MKKSIRIKEVWIHLIVWVCLISFPVGVSISQFGEIQHSFLPRIFLNPILVYLNYLLLVPKLLLRKRIFTYILISTALLVGFNILVNSLFPSSPFERIRDIAEIKNIEPLKNISYAITTVVSFSFFLLGGVLGLTKDLYRREKLNNEKEVQRQETELQFLRAQLNPHFLFNSLNSIYSLVRNKSREAPEAVITLSELMRYMLYEAKKEQVPLSKEIDYIKNYFQLQILRLSDSENVKIKISGSYEKKLIAPLLLIPFVENAFKYGTDFKGTTYVNISLKVVDKSLFFNVKNKIGVYKKDDFNSGIGLENIKNRLSLLYPNSHVLKINKNNGYHTIDLELLLA